MKRFLLIISLAFLSNFIIAQVVYEPVENNPVYDLLDELSTIGIVEINSVAKPYSRNVIAQKLKEASELANSRTGELNRRIKEEIQFYLKDYAFELGINDTSSHSTWHHGVMAPVNASQIGYDPIGYSLSLKNLKLAIRPILGGRFLGNENGNVWEAVGGGEMFGYIGRHVGYYVNIKQTWQSEAMVKPLYFTMEEGKVWKEGKNGSVSNTEWRGGVSVAWKWGDFGVYKDRPIWGNGIHGTNILSGHAPSFPFIQLHLKPAKWIEFRYFHGWLGNVAPPPTPPPGGRGDSSYFSNTAQKYIAANIITVFPWRTLAVSIGNSIIYSSDHIIPAFLIPFQFFKATDQALTSLSVNNGQNSQLFFSIDARVLKMAHIYFSAYIEDLKMSALLSSDELNEMGWKAGISFDRLPIRNLSVAAEYTRTNPLTYRHIVTPTEFYFDQYCLGNYLRDDSQEFFIRLRYKPLARLQINLSYNWAEHGIDYTNPEKLNNYLLPFIGEVNYSKNAVETTVRMQFLNCLTGWISCTWQNLSGDVKYSPEIMRGRTNTLMVGVNLGL